MDINDLTIVLTNYGKSGMTWGTGDSNSDGKADINDLTIVLTNYGRLRCWHKGRARAPSRARWRCWPRDSSRLQVFTGGRESERIRYSASAFGRAGCQGRLPSAGFSGGAARGNRPAGRDPWHR